MKFKSLNRIILETVESYDHDAIVEISSIEQLREMSIMSGSPGAAQGHAGKQEKPPVSTKKAIAKFNKKEEENQRLKGVTEMINRKNLVIEMKLREYIRNKLRSVIHEKQKAELQQEMQLRKVIQNLLAEGDISDIHPHRSTGINVLEDLLKKMVPTLRTDYKRLTTDQSQRDSFRAHLVKAIKDSLMPMMVNDKYRPEDESGAAPPADSGALLSEPTEEPEAPEADAEDEGGDDDEAALAALEEAIFEELANMSEIDIDVKDGDEEKKVPVEKDDTPSEEEAFGAGLEGMDETGRNMAFTCFKKVSQYILDAYDSLANPKDKEIFIDYLITNVKLYFDKFEGEISKTVDEPTTQQYDDAKA